MKNQYDITNSTGFYLTYFELLPLYRTQMDAFNYLNNEVKFITGIKPYRSYVEFRKDISFE